VLQVLARVALVAALLGPLVAKLPAFVTSIVASVA
jgi:hypothetical protein